MIKYKFTSHGHIFTRVSEAAAKKAYIDGITIALCPCKLRPGTPWHPECILRKTPGNTRTETENEFNSLLNQFEFYNCTKEAGKRASFFIGKELV